MKSPPETGADASAAAPVGMEKGERSTRKRVDRILPVTVKPQSKRLEKNPEEASPLAPALASPPEDCASLAV